MSDITTATSLQVNDLRCEYAINPLGIDVVKPRLSWLVESEERGQRQTAYHILVASSLEGLGRNEGDLWDSGVVPSSQTHHIAYAGRTLQSGQRAWWKVRAWDRDGQTTEFSGAAWWEMGLLAAEDWKGQWIGTLPGEMTEEKTQRLNGIDPVEMTVELEAAAYLRRVFEIKKPIARAQLYATAKGVYELNLNDRRVGSAVLAPGWTDYNRRIQYQTYDVTDLLQPDTNVLGATIGTGWYTGHVGWDAMKGYYGSRLQLLAQLVVDYTDGTSQVISSDSQWRATTQGAIRYSDLLEGEMYDARRELTGWGSPQYDDSDWVEVETPNPIVENLVAECSPAIRVTEEIAPVDVKARPDGTAIFDMGQNMVGWVRLTVECSAGTRLQLRFAEVLDKDGGLYTENLRTARQTDTYIARGGGIEIFEPHFTFHGFRYVELAGFEGMPALETLKGRVVHSDTPPTGSFQSSDAMVNQLYRNILWGQRGNFLSVPTDCPQRDERLGWMGDAQIFARTAAYDMDVSGFFIKWMKDIVDSQSAEGAYSNVVPRLLDFSDGAPAWGDAGIIVPWTIYQMYGDTRVIEQQFSSMEGWMDYLANANPDFLRVNKLNNNFGDWLALDNKDTVTDIDPLLDPGGWMEAVAATPKDLLATAYWAYDASLMAKMAAAIGRESEERRYTELFEKIKSAFIAAYVSEDGRVAGESQTSYVLALFMDLFPQHLRKAAGEHLVYEIERRDWHLATGFVGVGYLCLVLSELGYSDVAYKLLLNTTFPSWGYSIKQGATTIWERWDGWTEERGFQSPSMNSFNHYSLGSVGQWLYQYVAGIDTDMTKPGFQHIIVKPQIDARLERVEASYQAVTGMIRARGRPTEPISHYA